MIGQAIIREKIPQLNWVRYLILPEIFFKFLRSIYYFKPFLFVPLLPKGVCNRVITQDFEQAYKLWKDGKITAVKAMKQANMTKATFYRKVIKYEELNKPARTLTPQH